MSSNYCIPLPRSSDRFAFSQVLETTSFFRFATNYIISIIAHLDLLGFSACVFDASDRATNIAKIMGRYIVLILEILLFIIFSPLRMFKK